MVATQRGTRTWLQATLAAVVFLSALFVFFAVVPHRLTLFVERRGGSITVRDLVVTIWFVASIAGTAWVLSRLQRRGLI